MSQTQPISVDPMVYPHALSLLRYTVQGKPIPAIPAETADFCTEENLGRIYKLTKYHDLAHLVTPALESLKLPESDILKKFHTIKMRAIYRFARMDYEYQQICTILETVWQHCRLAPGKQYQHRLSNEFFLFHHLAHMSYHFVSGCCGIRPFLDLWLLHQQMPYDDHAVRSITLTLQSNWNSMSCPVVPTVLSPIMWSCVR